MDVTGLKFDEGLGEGTGIWNWRNAAKFLEQLWKEEVYWFGRRSQESCKLERVKSPS